MREQDSLKWKRNNLPINRSVTQVQSPIPYPIPNSTTCSLLEAFTIKPTSLNTLINTKDKTYITKSKGILSPIHLSSQWFCQFQTIIKTGRAGINNNEVQSNFNWSIVKGGLQSSPWSIIALIVRNILTRSKEEVRAWYPVKNLGAQSICGYPLPSLHSGQI